MAFRSINPDEIFHPRGGGNYKVNFPKPASLITIIAIICIVGVITTIFYTIQPNEVGVVLRFGKFIGTTPPGLHFRIPFGIERIYPVRVEFVYKEEFGFRTKTPGIRTTYDKRSYADESLMLTGDLNVMDVEWIVQYRIKDPFALLFNIRNIRATLRDISESVMRKIVGDFSFNEVLTTKRVEINNLAQVELQTILDTYGTGIEIITVKLQDVNPPDPVQSAFNEVNEAKQEKEKLINQAREIYNQKIPQAQGQALKIISEAEGYGLEKINTAEGDAKRFLLLLDAYNKAKDITRKRLYLENMNEILTKAGRKYIVDEQQTGILPLLQLENKK
ncbi:MAG: FtsH protease activity modulator HflK [Candidatus Omnitrophota bacterium]